MGEESHEDRDRGCGRSDRRCRNFDAEERGSSSSTRAPRHSTGFRRRSRFRGSRDGTDEEVLRRAGAQEAESSLSLTEATTEHHGRAGSHRIVRTSLRSSPRSNDPVRAAAYAELGVGHHLPDQHQWSTRCQVPEPAMQTGPASTSQRTPGHGIDPSAETSRRPRPSADRRARSGRGRRRSGPGVASRPGSS